MSIRVGFLLLLLSFLMSSILRAQPTATPWQWIGQWKGEMTNHKPGGSSGAIPVSLTIAELPDGSLQFRTVYNEDAINGLRDYRLEPDSSGAHQYILDENNGIRLRAQFISGVLIEAFQVGDQQLTSRYQLDTDGRLVHEVTFWDVTDKMTTTGTGTSGENGTPVHSFIVSGIQRTVLHRIE